VHYILQGMNENRQIERLDQNSLDNSDLHSFLFSQNHKKSEKFVDFKINKLVETDIKLIAFYIMYNGIDLRYFYIRIGS
jgi:hypothetical protein